MAKRKTTEEFIKQAYKLYDNKYDLTEVYYRNSCTKVIITCNEHNVRFLQNPFDFLNNHVSCKKCIKEKIKKTNLERHGVEYPAQSLKVQEKTKKTNLERHGVEYPAQSLKVQEKTKKTNLERHGVEYPMQSLNIQEKSKKSNLKNNGVEYPAQSSKIYKKMQQGWLKALGVDHPSKSEKIKNRKKQTNLKNCGFECNLQDSKTQEKIRQTNLTNHGVEQFNQSQISTKSFKLLNDSDYLKYEHHINELTLFEISIKLNIGYTTINRYFKKFNIPIYRFQRSSGEKQVDKFVQSLGYLIVPNYQNILPGKYEIDIFIPELNKAIEYNGLYWHKYRPSDYHLWKTTQSDMKSVPLFHVWEDMWCNYRTKTESMIIKFLNDEPQIDLTKQIKIDLATDNPRIYLDLGYEIQERLIPQLYSEGVWDCGKIIMAI